MHKAKAVSKYGRVFNGKPGLSKNETTAYDKYIKWCKCMNLKASTMEQYLKTTRILQHNPIGHA